MLSNLQEWYYGLWAATFLIVLLYAAWQDVKCREISGRFLVIAGLLGGLFCFLTGRDLKMTGMSVLVGGALLLLHRITQGGIGDGDGWFFVVTGLYLTATENLLLLLSGIIFCGIYSLTLLAVSFAGGGRIGKQKLPYRPYLLPAGLWLILF